MTRRVAVIGGGVAGLATAALLAHRGDEVTVFEARDEVGGRAGSWQHEGFRFDTGPSWFLMPEVFEHYFRLLGTSMAEQLDLVRLDPAYRMYTEGDPDGLDVHSGTDAAASLFESVEPGSGRRLRAYLDSARDAYDLAVSRFLYDPYENLRGLTHRDLLRRLPRLAGLLTRPLHTHIRRRFRDPRLQRLLGYPAVFLGGSPFEVPSLYHLMSHLDLGDRVLYPQGGFTVLIERIAALARERGVVIRTGAEVVAIETEGAVATGVRVRDAAGTASVHEADVVVGAGDLHHTETALLPEALQTYPERWWRRRTPSPGALLILLGVRGELPELAHHTLLFADDWRGNFGAIFSDSPRVPDPASVYVCRPSATDSTVAPEGHENLFVLVPMPADARIGRGGVDGAGDPAVERAADRMIAQIAAWSGAHDLAERIVVRRTIAPGDFAADLRTWRGNALGLSHTLAQSALFRPKNASRKVSGLYYAGADVLPGIGLPMCLISAELVAKRLSGDVSAARLPEPAPAPATERG
ncbi:phytoene desaturase family protein [Microbacterium sp. NPDC078428]|uniref:phytoene desaturase family protein n=1 Tax=Microbacterium sp. NPDC078428 TaxID=3364190 RepID=UPI0037C6CEDC